VSETLDEDWMRIALTLAETASERGEVPVGSVVVDSLGRELGRAHNERELRQDPTAHAEVVALRRAARTAGQWRLEGATLFSTLEPCAMCAGALVNARVRRLVYGAPDPKAGAVASLFSVPTDGRLNHQVAITSGLLADDSVQLLQSFFARLRAQGKK
jgi:tRNA(adenine34) deaminase